MGMLEDLKAHLASEGVGDGSTGWPIFTGFLPPTPDKAIALFDTPGEEPEIIRTKTEGERIYDKPAFQVRVRGLAYKTTDTREKIQACFEALHQNEPVPATSEAPFVYIYGVSSGPLPLGLDGNNRPGFTWNFRTMRERI